VPDREAVEVSFVMPCLNEAETLEGCIRAATRCISENSLSAEIIIADNGSTDGSQSIAVRNGARVVPVSRKGYGNALIGGIDAARGRYIIMGDSDQSYDFGDAMKFVERLRAGYDLVMGNRFDSRGGGGVQPGAMPIKNRYLGNPVLTFIGRTLFRCPARDFHCGLRGFSKDAFSRMEARSAGMEFASEMVIKATLREMRITEVPIRLHPDGRSRPPHLKPWRDGWRHLRFMMCLSPRWTLFAPGALLLMAGLALGAAVAFGNPRIGGAALGVHTLVAAMLAVLIGYQWIMAALVMRVFGLRSEIGPAHPSIDRVVRWFNLERGLVIGAALCVVGLVFMLRVLWIWDRAGFGPLDPVRTLPSMLAGATVVALGVQTVMMALVLAMIRARRDDAAE
jgi:glycosyltransferase involved in cell wall biosynthesis